MCFRDREQYRSIKMDTEEDMNEMLRPSKQRAGTICIKIGLPGKEILSKRKGLREFLFS